MRYLPFILAICLFIACDPEGINVIDEESDPIKEPKTDPIAAIFGEWVNLPAEFRFDGAVSDIQATDNGLYMVKFRVAQEDFHILRYDLVQNKIVAGTWEKYKHEETSENYILDTYTPLNSNTELLKPHDIFITNTIRNFHTPSFFTVNMSKGNSIKKEVAPKHNFGSYEEFGTVKKDGKGNDWQIFYGKTVSDADLIVIKIKQGSAPAKDVFRFREPLADFIAAPQSALLLGYSSNKRFHIITPEGKATYYDLSKTLKEPLNLGIKKLRETNRGIFFQIEDKIFRYYNNTLSLFYTIKDDTYTIGPNPNFCIDDRYMFTSDGIRKKLTGFYEETSMFPTEPTTGNADKQLDYYDRLTAYKTGHIETSTDPDDKYYYIVDGLKNRILVIAKDYQSL